MTYGRIAGSSRVNDAIYRCFEFISPADATRFVRKFAEQPHDEDQVMHTFRELILGAFLASQRLAVQSERPIAGKTPDWSVLSDTELQCVIELTNFHTDQRTEEDMKTSFAAQRLWSGWQKPHGARLYASLQSKCRAYKAVVSDLSVPYVIGLYGDFNANVDQEEVEECLHDPEAGLFQLYPEVSGVLFFDVSSARYWFRYLANPTAAHPFVLPDGVLDLSSGFANPFTS